VDGDRFLRLQTRGAVSLREHLSLMGQPPSGGCLWSRRARRVGPPPVAACGVTEPDVPAPTPVGARGVAAPDKDARASASIDAAASNASPARRAESWKSSIIARCCFCVGWVTGGAPDSCVPLISSAAPPNKSANGNSSGGVSLV
jgi:hypothetical protein